MAGGASKEKDIEVERKLSETPSYKADSFLRKAGNKALACLLIGGLSVPQIAWPKGGSVQAQSQTNVAIAKSEAKDKYHLELVFLEHYGSENAEGFFAEVDKAAKEGKPFKIVFIESASEKESTYKEQAEKIDMLLYVTRLIYEQRLERGETEQQAKSYCLRAFRKAAAKEQNGKTIASEFNSTVLVEAAIRGMKVLPIEAGSEEQSVNEAKTGDMLDKNAEKIRKMVSTNAPLGELMRCELEADRLLDRSLADRDKKIVMGLEKRFMCAQEIFPELQGSNCLKAIGYLGFSHLNVYNNFDRGNGNLSIEKKELMDDDFSLIARIERELVRVPKKDAYIEALMAYGLQDTIDRLRRVDRDYAKHVVDNVFNITEQQFERIDADSSNQPPYMRRAFLWNSITGTNRP